MFIRQERSLKEFITFYPVISFIVIVNFILWYLTDFSQSSIGKIIIDFGMGSNFLVHEGQYWRLVTPIFLHSGLRHVLFNSFSLVIFGPAIEQMLGRFKFILTYLIAGIAGNVATFLLGPEIYFHLGASGAVYGIFGVYLYMIAVRQDLIDPMSRQIIIIITVLGFIMTFVRPNINIYAHLFGYVGGLIMAPIVLTRAKPFSIWRNRYKATPKDDDDPIKFDPNRWQKKRIPAQLKKNIFWVVLGILIIFALFGRFF